MKRAVAVMAMLALPIALTACAGRGGSEDELMKAGLDALYTRHDASAAATDFRRVLELNPAHYGATYQLAAALDAAGKKDEARPVWEKVLTMAEAYNDGGTIDTARARLGKPTRQEEFMTAGLDALYKRRDPTAAIAEFRKTLELNRQHYGANYQLAAALDAAGKHEEAHQQWQAVLKMAEAYNDRGTADTARARLAAK